MDKSAILDGLAAGDMNGGPTAMARLLAQSDPFDVDAIGRRYLAWWCEDGFDTGPVCAAVFDLVQSGLSFPEASLKVHNELSGMTAGCNPAHRISPLAESRLPDSELAQAAMDEAALTHHHPLAGDVSAAVVLLCRYLINGLDWQDALRRVEVGRMAETVTALRTRRRSSINNDGYAPDVLAAAVYFIGSSRGLKEALSRSIEFAGPANYCPVLVGAIGGVVRSWPINSYWIN